MAHFEQNKGATDEWYTPEYVFDALGAVFDVDVAYPSDRSLWWIPTRAVIKERSLETSWRGFVWCNPPFGGRSGLVPWLDKFFEHGDGVCLTPDRTSASWWQAAAAKANAILFCTPKIKFIGHDMKPGGTPSTGTCLFAVGKQRVGALAAASVAGLGHFRG